MRLLLVMVLCVAVLLSAASAAAAWFLHGSGTATAPPSVTIVSITPTTGSFTAGTSTAFMTETAALSAGTFVGTWSIATSGVDHAGSTCSNYGSNFTINSSSGAITNNGAVGAGSYPGICVVATQAGVSNSPYTQAVTATGSAGAPSIASIGPTTGSFSAGTSTAFMTVTATMSSGSFTGSWSITTSGTDHAGTTCSNYSSNFTINSATGAITNASGVAAGSYPGLCATATQAGATNSPYTQALSVTGVGAGTTITSFTVQNSDPSSAITPGAAGYPIIMGQSWARGDLPTTGSPLFPICKDHSNGAVLVCQFDDIATHRENGDDNSWRHSSFTVLLPATSPQYTSGTIPACTANPCPGTFQVDFVSQSGTYSPNVHGSINDICTGHDINIKFTDVRNQDDTLRGPTGFTGSLTFDVCSNLTNTGRDAPRQFAQGAVRNGWLIQGPPVYGNGAKDPLLYVKCYMSQTYTLSGTLGPLQHYCSVHNSWMNVAAGSAGNMGSPGPVGFTSDPQSVSYRPVLYDGSTVILDWGTTYFDETVPDTALTVSTGVWLIPALGPLGSFKSWGLGNAFRYSDSATPPAATQYADHPFTNGKLIYSCGMIQGGCAPSVDASYDPTRMAFSKYPWGGFESHPTYTAQGTGNSTFSWRVQHYHWGAWWTLDPSAYENWAPVGSATRYVPKIDPQFTSAQKMYWKQTGTIAALKDSDPSTYGGAPRGSNMNNTRYAPMDVNAFALGTGVGGRPEIGLHNEYFAEAWSAQTPAYWQLVRSSSLIGYAQGQGDLLSEVTARIPPVNNGPPAANHAGGSGSYSDLGGPFPGVLLLGGSTQIVNVVPPLENVPYSDCTVGSQCSNWAGGPTFAGTDNSHQSAYAFGPYQLYGSEMYLDALQVAASRAIYGNGGLCQYFHWAGITGPSGNICTVSGVTYYALSAPSDERRGQAWSNRDIGAAVAYGSDSLMERTYFNDQMNETYWFNIACSNLTGPPVNGIGTLYKTCALIDPPTPNSGIVLGGGEQNAPVGAGSLGNGGYDNLINTVSSTFFDAYVTFSYYTTWATLHAPMSKDYLSQQYRVFAATCGDGNTTPAVANSPSSMFCGIYYYANPQRQATPTSVVNITDGGDYQSDFWIGGNSVTFTAGSSVIGPYNSAVYVNGTPDWITQFSASGYSGSGTPAPSGHFVEKMKFYNYPQSGCSTLPDQITDGQWYYLVNNATAGHWQISATPDGPPIGPFTVGGVAYSGTPCQNYVRIDATNAAAGPTAGMWFWSGGYAVYAEAAIIALGAVNASLGNLFGSNPAFLVSNMESRWSNNVQGNTFANSLANDSIANNQWDSTVVVK